MEQKSGLADLAETFCWHTHTEVLCSLVTEPIQDYIDFMKTYHSKATIKMRIRLMKPVKHPELLPREFVGAVTNWKGFYREERDPLEINESIWRKSQKISNKYREVRVKYLPEIEALHKKDCQAAIEGVCLWNGKALVFL